MNLKYIRKNINIKQEILAKALNIKQNTFSQWENGICEPSISFIPKLAEVLGCSIEEIVFALIETKKQAQQN